MNGGRAIEGSSPAAPLGGTLLSWQLRRSRPSLGLPSTAPSSLFCGLSVLLRARVSCRRLTKFARPQQKAYARVPRC
eukprot:6228583-Alexandrium_andersonii.AAC.1